MITKRTLCILSVLCFGAYCTPATPAATVYYDDFEDGSVIDGTPVRWTGGTSGLPQVNSGDLVVSGVDVPFASIPQSLLNVADVSVRTVARMVDGPSMGIAARSNAANYYGYLFVDDTEMTAGIGAGGSLCCDDLVPPVNIGVDPRQQDVAMQLDVFDDKIRFWVWPAGEPMPTVPTVEAVDTRVKIGTVGVWVAGADWDQPNPQDVATGRFRFVHVANTPLPEPSTTGLLVFGTCAGLVLKRKR